MVRIVDGQILPDLPGGGGGGNRSGSVGGRARWGASVHSLGGAGGGGGGGGARDGDGDGDDDGEQAYFGGDSTSFLGRGRGEGDGSERGDRGDRSSYDSDGRAGTNRTAPGPGPEHVGAGDDHHFTDELQDMVYDTTWGAPSLPSRNMPLVPSTPTAVCCAMLSNILLCYLMQSCYVVAFSMLQTNVAEPAVNCC